MHQFVRLVLSPRRLETRSGGTANRIIRRSAAELDSAQIGFRTGEFHVASGHPCDVLADVALDHFERYAATRNAVPHRSAVLLRLCTGLGVNASAFVAVRLTPAPLRTGRDVSVPAGSRAA